jgi:hypothetical protein
LAVAGIWNRRAHSVVRSELVVTAPRLFLCLRSGLDVLSALALLFFLSVAVTFVIALRTPLPATVHAFSMVQPCDVYG